MVEKLKDNPQALMVYQTIRVITDLPRKMGDGKPFPAYDGPVVYFCATHITADFDYFRNEVLEVKTDDHPSVISWKGLNPKTEFLWRIGCWGDAMPWYWIVIIISAIIGPFEAMHALNKARRKREKRK